MDKIYPTLEKKWDLIRISFNSLSKIQKKIQILNKSFFNRNYFWQILCLEILRNHFFKVLSNQILKRNTIELRSVSAHMVGGGCRYPSTGHQLKCNRMFMLTICANYVNIMLPHFMINIAYLCQTAYSMTIIICTK